MITMAGCQCSFDYSEQGTFVRERRKDYHHYMGTAETTDYPLKIETNQRLVRLRGCESQCCAAAMIQ